MQRFGKYFQIFILLAIMGCCVFLVVESNRPSEDIVIARAMDKGMDHVLEHISPPEIPDNYIVLREFAGHNPDSLGTHDFRDDIQRAIDTLAKIGGGSLYLTYPHTYDTVRPIMTYRIKGPIQLRSNIGLQLGRSIKLYSEFDPPSYRPGGRGVLSRYEGTTLYTHSPLIRGFNCENISISCRGALVHCQL